MMDWLKNPKTWIEGLWCVLGGFCFTVYVHVNTTGSIYWNHLLNWRNWWTYPEFTLPHFLFGFIVTLILICSIKFYRRQL